MIRFRGRPARWHRATAIPLLCLIVLAGCSGADATPTPSTIPWVTGLGGTLTVGIDRAPTGCNPNTTSGNTWANQFVLEPVLPSAFVTSPSGQSIYDSAVITQAEVQSLSPQTVVYSINPKAVWSDGVPITSADFIYAWQQQRGDALTAGTPADEIASILGYRDIASVVGSNSGRTVTVTFKTHFSDWQRLFSDLLPAHVMEKIGWNPACTSVDPAIDLSGGPFEIGSVTPGKQVSLIRNPKWWGQKADLNRLMINTASGTRQLTHWLTTGQVQVIQPSSYAKSYLETVSAHQGLNSSEQISSTLLQLDFSATSPSTSLVSVRQAIAHAIDRQALVDSVVGWTNSYVTPAASHLYSQNQGSYPGPSPVPLQVAAQPGYNPPAVAKTPTPAMPFPLEADPSAVERLLTEADYTRSATGAWIDPEGKPVVLRMAVDVGDSWAESTSALIVAQLQSAGIGVTTSTYPDVRTTGSALASGAADMALIPLTTSPYPTDALAWYTMLLGPPGVDGSQDWTNYDDPALNMVLTKAAEQLNPVQASPLYAQADLMLWNSMITFPLFSEPMSIAWSSYDSGIGANPYGPGLLWFPQTWGIRVPPTSPDTAPQN